MDNRLHDQLMVNTSAYVRITLSEVLYEPLFTLSNTMLNNIREVHLQLNNKIE